MKNETHGKESFGRESGSPSRREARGRQSTPTNNPSSSTAESLHSSGQDVSSMQTKIAELKILNINKNRQSVDAAAIAGGTGPHIRPRRLSGDVGQTPTSQPSFKERFPRVADVDARQQPSFQASVPPASAGGLFSAAEVDEKALSDRDETPPPSPSASYRSLAVKAAEERQAVSQINV